MTIRPYLTDSFPTPTSKAQAETENVLLKHIPDRSEGESPPTLLKNAHMQFLVRNLVQGFPSRYISQDASQPWLMFWTIQSFSILQVGLDPGNKQRYVCILFSSVRMPGAYLGRAIDTILTWQHPDGGFGGGPGQEPHLLPTYAAVCALAIVGRPGPGGGWDQINRWVGSCGGVSGDLLIVFVTSEKIYKFFMSLKQPDGSFLVAHHAEVDVRFVFLFSSSSSNH